MKVRGFEIISKEQFIKDSFSCDFEVEEEYTMLTKPRRATKRSSGYDIYSPFNFVLFSGDTIKIPTGLKAYMQEDEELLIFPRSSVGFKYKVKIDNTIAKIDSDYYNNIGNEGHIFLSLTNTGSKDWVVNIGDSICQGSFYKYLITDDDNPVSDERVGGIGSTNR